MATEYHLTPEGPRRCAVDRSNPNSRGCPLGGTHFDSFDDAMEVYTEDLKKTFGEFHVLVRPSSLERARRVGYRSLDGIEKVRANPQVQAAVENLKIIGTKAREAIEEIRGRSRVEANPERSSTLPESVATEPMAEVDLEDQQAESLSEELFSQGKPESMAEFAARISASARTSPLYMPPLDRSEVDAALAMIDARDAMRRAKSIKPKRSERLRRYRAVASRRVTTAKNLASSAAISATRFTGKKLTDAGYALRASASVAKDSAILKTRVAAARAQDRAIELGGAIQQRASRMSIPADHVRPGDTFDGTTVRAVEATGDGRMKISYQAQPGGPTLSTTVAADRSMRVDRKTRREARNSRLASKIAKPIAQTRELSQRVSKASANQLAIFGKTNDGDLRFGSIERSIRQQERAVKQRELIDRLRSLRSTAADRVLQRS